MSEKRGFLLVGGSMNGQRVVLQGVEHYVVVKPREPLSLRVWEQNPENSFLVDTIEYRRVRDIPGVLAPSGIPAALVLDMLVEGYKP